MIVLAGGFGTRLKSVVNEVPKALAPVGQVPFLYLQIEHFEKLKSLEIPIIQECHDLCSCDVNKCPNRLIQHGIQHRLEIFRTELKGWGLRSPQRIRKAMVK